MIKTLLLIAAVAAVILGVIYSTFIVWINWKWERTFRKIYEMRINGK
jgi:hypothetical protein